MLLSQGIHLLMIFGFLVSPICEGALKEANRAVTVLLTPSRYAPIVSTMTATNHHQGMPVNSFPDQLHKLSSQPETRELSADSGIRIWQFRR